REPGRAGARIHRRQVGRRATRDRRGPRARRLRRHRYRRAGALAARAPREVLGRRGSDRRSHPPPAERRRAQQAGCVSDSGSRAVPAFSGAAGEASRSAPRAVAWWLLICCALLFAMVVVGGVTRLTHSGLSITEWQPIVGALPPLDEADWNAAFA